MALLRWHHKWGGISKKWIEQYQQTGKEPPAPFFEKPELDPALETTLAAFYDLGTERQMGMTLGPIPRSKIREYATAELDLSGDDRERFCWIIAQVDGDYLQMISAKSDDGPPMRDMASPSDVEGTRRVLQNLGKKPARKQMKPNG